MSERSNRVALSVFGVTVTAASAVVAALGAGLFGAKAAQRPLLTTTVVRWWNEGGGQSFAVVGVVGALCIVAGAAVLRGELRRSAGQRRSTTFVLEPRSTHGQTSLRAPAVAHILEADLAAGPGARRAAVGLFGQPPHLELRTTLDVYDDCDLGRVRAHVGDVLDRLQMSTGLRPERVQVTVRYTGSPVATAPRRLQ